MNATTPHLLQLLAFEYFQTLNGATAGVEMRKLGDFLKFAADYLDANRPTTMGIADNQNFSFNLQNGKTVMLCPSLDESNGAMAAGGQNFVQVSKSYGGMNNVESSGIPIDGIVHEVPKAVPVGYRQADGPKDLKQTGTMIDFTKSRDASLR